jgi:glycosyltransferase involved in cell wall biosynthesis
VRVVFVHRRGAGQFRHLAAHLGQRGVDVTVVCEHLEGMVPGVRFIRHGPVPSAPQADRGSGHLTIADDYVQRAHRVAEALDNLNHTEGSADVIVGHIGWGGLLFARDVLPDTPALGYCEYYFHRYGGDIGFNPREPVTIGELERARVRNMVQRATLEAIDAGFSPTQWQRSRYPKSTQPRIALCHEGVDTDLCRPDAAARYTLPDGRVVSAGDPVVTYAARGLEPYRGFPEFMRAAARIAAKRRDVIFLVAGGDDVSYGRRPPNAVHTWREVMMAETGIDPSRIVFLGTVDYAALIRLFQVSAAHVYLTVPFVLSWSMLEAMACGALVVGSNTAPVQEVITDRQNGLLADFWDADALAETVLRALDAKAGATLMRQAARATIEQRYRRADCLQRQVSILMHLTAGAERIHA